MREDWRLWPDTAQVFTAFVVLSLHRTILPKRPLAVSVDTLSTDGQRKLNRYPRFSFLFPSVLKVATLTARGRLGKIVRCKDSTTKAVNTWAVSGHNRQSSRIKAHRLALDSPPSAVL